MTDKSVDYENWFRNKVEEALNNTSETTSHKEAVARFKKRLES